ncbi:hypothetical protein DSO57_1014283 [Entomophthora muscae]|uniref:Uncharacterized protein n=1 Tax=Entomophthora muscae TaxID=34485 RepID=A0ACC2S7G3_9FUNG|nr:hypothetical protein DSO57_1014283 [Entomophthora muscae]
MTLDNSTPPTLVPGLPLVFPHSTLSIAVYTSIYYVLKNVAGSFRRYNLHAKAVCWVMTIYPIITALTGFQFANLLPYLLQVVPTVTGYYNIFLALGWLIYNFLDIGY